MYVLLSKARSGFGMMVAITHRVMDRFFGGYLQGYLLRSGYGSPARSIKVIRHYSDAHARFSDVSRWPRDISSFQKLSFLFHSSQANFGICLLAFDEADYLYEVASTIQGGRLAEIGRFKGGSTFLIATAMGPHSQLDSFDNHSECTVLDENNRRVTLDGNVLDAELNNALEQYGLDGRVQTIVQDSTTLAMETSSYDLVFIDGDHSYEGAKRDFLTWAPAVKRGGHLFLHDAARTRPFSSATSDLLVLVAEIERDYAQQFEKIDSVGTLVHFRKVG